MSEKADVLVALDKAHKEMCDAAKRQWDGKHALQMSIPADERHDTDVIVCDVLMDAKNEITRLRGQLEDWNESYEETLKEPPACDDRIHCTCVPPLRLALKRSREALDKLIEAVQLEVPNTQAPDECECDLCAAIVEAKKAVGEAV